MSDIRTELYSWSCVDPDHEGCTHFVPIEIFTDATREIDRLRTELARAEGEISTTMTERLKYENDRLRATLAQMTEMQEATHKFRLAAEQECERLVVVLETVADMWPWDGVAIRELVRETLAARTTEQNREGEGG